jgi:bacterioferritin
VGTEGIKVANIDTKKLIGMLNEALCDEWFSSYHYWLSARLVRGVIAPALAAEFKEHVKEELGHADKLASRIIQLGGTPALSPKQWYEVSPNGFNEPTDHSAKALLKQAINGEQKAIRDYNAILEFVQGKDHATYSMISAILQDELEHEEEFQSLLEDIS